MELGTCRISKLVATSKVLGGLELGHDFSVNSHNLAQGVLASSSVRLDNAGAICCLGRSKIGIVDECFKRDASERLGHMQHADL